MARKKLLHTVVAAQQGSGHAHLVAQDLLGLMLPEHLDVGGVEDSLLHGLGGTEDVAAHDHVDLAAERGQVGGLLAGSVASSDYRHILAAVEEAVAGGAGRNALALEFLLRFQTEIAGCCSCGYDDCIGLYPFLIVDLKPEGPLGEVGLGHDAETDVGSEPLGLGAEVVHHLLALDSLGIAGEILHRAGCPRRPLP